MNRVLNMPRGTLILNQFSLSKIAKICLNRHILTPAVLLACSTVSINASANICAPYGEYMDCSLDSNNIGDVTVSLGSTGDYSHLTVGNDSSFKFTVKDVNLTNASTEGVWDDNLYNDDYIGYRPIIEIAAQSTGSSILENLNVDFNKERINNILIGVWGYDREHNSPAALAITKSTVKTYSDTVFSFDEFYYSHEDQVVGEILNLNVVDINHSEIINNKEHVYTDIVGYDANYNYQLEHFLGSTFYFGGHQRMVYVDSDTIQQAHINFNINNSYLKAEALVNLEPMFSCCGDEDEIPEILRFNFNSSQAEFKNLVNVIGEIGEMWVDEEGYSSDESIEINLNHSTLTSGIYSHANGGATMANSSLNLANGSIFNYLGGCESECSLYDYGEYLTEPEMALYFRPPENFEDSYINGISINSGSSFVFANTGTFKDLLIGNLNGDGTGTIVMNTDVANFVGDKLHIDTATGKFNLSIRDSGKEPTDTSVGLGLIYVKHGENDQFSLNNGNGVDIGAYTYTLSHLRNGDEYTWYLGHLSNGGDGDGDSIDGDNNGSNNGNNGGNEGDTNELKTSPATDGMLSMASATQFILNDEMTHSHKRQREMHLKHGSNGSAWGRLIGNRMEMDGPASSGYKLVRQGMELGFDWNTELNSERLIYGMSMSYSDNTVKHDRGGKSSIDAYTLGFNATLLKTNNVYIDGVLKYVHFNSDVNIRTTNGSHLESSYKQNGIAGALELGYRHVSGQTGNQSFIEPYTRISYASISGKDVTLNSGLQADIKSQNSFIGELGASTGKEFLLSGGAILTPYLKLAVQREFIDHNDVYINKKHKFNNDFSGTRGNYGAGIDLIMNDIILYAKINHMSGHRVESPVSGDIGFRLNF